MKKLSKLKLNVLCEANLLGREMNGLRGGERVCTCSCATASSSSNRSANFNLGLAGGYSTSGNNCYWEGEIGYMDGVHHTYGYSC